MLFSGTARLMERGIPVYEDLFRNRGIGIRKTEKGYELSGKLRSGTFRIPGGISSQYVTGLLFVLPFLDPESRVEVVPPVESRPYIEITRQVMRTFGAEILEPEENRFSLKKGSGYRPAEYIIEGDWSGAAFFHAMNALGSSVTVTGLNPDSIQGDRAILTHLKTLDSEHPEIDLSDCPDLGPVLFAAAAAKNGARFTGTRRLRIKESDRVSAMAEELEKFGVRIEIGENSARVEGGCLHSPKAVLDGHNDHRIVMSLAVLMTLTGGELEGAEAVSKSFPDFFRRLSELGVKIHP